MHPKIFGQHKMALMWKVTPQSWVGRKVEVRLRRVRERGVIMIKALYNCEKK